MRTLVKSSGATPAFWVSGALLGLDGGTEPAAGSGADQCGRG